jgi:hypothetical protein
MWTKVRQRDCQKPIRLFSGNWVGENPLKTTKTQSYTILLDRRWKALTISYRRRRIKKRKILLQPFSPNASKKSRHLYLSRSQETPPLGLKSAIFLISA